MEMLCRRFCIFGRVVRYSGEFAVKTVYPFYLAVEKSGSYYVLSLLKSNFLSREVGASLVVEIAAEAVMKTA